MKFTAFKKFLTCLASSVLVLVAHWTEAGEPAQIPLYVSAVPGKPNIMLMVDTSGSMGTAVATDPARRSRMVVAKEAATNVVTNLTPTSGNPTVRLGLFTYNSGKGGKLLYPLAELNSDVANAIKSQISAMQASGVTPLATTLSDIGYYFSAGVLTTPLTLPTHPGSAAKTDSALNIFKKTTDTTGKVDIPGFDINNIKQVCTVATRAVTPADMPASYVSSGCGAHLRNPDGSLAGGATPTATGATTPVQMLVIGGTTAPSTGSPTFCTSTPDPTAIPPIAACSTQKVFRIGSGVTDCPPCSNADCAAGTLTTEKLAITAPANTSGGTAGIAVVAATTAAIAVQTPALTTTVQQTIAPTITNSAPFTFSLSDPFLSPSVCTLGATTMNGSAANVTVTAKNNGVCRLCGTLGCKLDSTTYCKYLGATGPTADDVNGLACDASEEGALKCPGAWDIDSSGTYHYIKNGNHYIPTVGSCSWYTAPTVPSNGNYYRVGTSGAYVYYKCDKYRCFDGETCTSSSNGNSYCSNDHPGNGSGPDRCNSDSKCYDKTCSGLCTNNSSILCDSTNSACQAGNCNFGSSQGFCSNDITKNCGGNSTCYVNTCIFYSRCSGDTSRSCTTDSNCRPNTCKWYTHICSNNSNRTCTRDSDCTSGSSTGTCKADSRDRCSHNFAINCDNGDASPCNYGSCKNTYDRCSNDFNKDCTYGNAAPCNPGVVCNKTCSDNRNNVCLGDSDCDGYCTNMYCSGTGSTPFCSNNASCNPDVTCEQCDVETPATCNCNDVTGTACATSQLDIVIGDGTAPDTTIGSTPNNTGGTVASGYYCFKDDLYYTVQYNGSPDVMVNPDSTPPGQPYTGKQLNWYFSQPGFKEGSLELTDTTAESCEADDLTTPIQNWCQKNFAVLISDGLPNQDRTVNSLLRDYTGDCYTGKCDATSNSLQMPGVSTPLKDATTSSLCSGISVAAAGSSTQCNKTGGACNLACENGAKAGRAYETNGSDYLDDVAKTLYDMDLRPDFADERSAEDAPANSKSNLVTYTIGFADPNLSSNSILNDAAVLSGGKFYFAGDAVQLADALDNVMSDISSQIGSSAAVATNSTQVGGDFLVYQAKFNSDGWFGYLNAFPVDANTGELQPVQWNAATLIPNPANRVILTYNPSRGGIGKNFVCNELTTDQKTALGVLSGDCSGGSFTNQGPWRVDYIRGDHTHEVINPKRKLSTGTETRSLDSSIAVFRNRTYLDPITQEALDPDPWLLGDIINSNPVYVGNKDNYGYDRLASLDGTEGEDYSAYLANKEQNRNMLYVGANDGMLHGFDASKDASTAGKEMVAYIPNAVYGNLLDFTSPSYNHRYFVDGYPAVGDAYFGDTWHTVLIGTTGAGGKAVFALDITNPGTPGSTSSFSSSNVLWEVSSSAAPNSTDLTTSLGFTNNLGYTISQSSVVRMQNGAWAALIANGYASTGNTRAILYILNVATGHIIKAIEAKNSHETSFNRDNGLSTPFPADIDFDGVIDYIYAGDLRGNMWKFDVTNADPDNWTVANDGKPLYVACDRDTSLPCPEDQRQPITSIPRVGTGEEGTYMVYFGTGKYFESIDNDLSNPQKQTFYGIKDHGVTVPSSGTTTRNTLVEQTTTQSTLNEKNWRTSSNNACANEGWFMDLPGVGERVVAFPKLHYERIIFTTLIPLASTNNVDCDKVSNGTGWLMELSARCGTPLNDIPPWDVNGDGVINSSDIINGQAPSGIESTIGIPTTPGIADLGDGSTGLEAKYITGSTGIIEKMNESRGSGSEDNAPPGGGGGGPGRKSWRQIR